jgi:transposase
MALTDEQWNMVEPLIPMPPRRSDGRGRPWRDPQEVLNAILWILRSGAPWHDLPHCYPPYQTCHRRFQKWVTEGVLESVLATQARHLRERGELLRVRPPGLHGHPTQVFVRWLLVPGRSIRGGRPRCRANPLWPRGNRRRARLRASSVSTSSWGLGYPPAGRRRGPRSGRRPSPLSHPGRARSGRAGRASRRDRRARAYLRGRRGP